MCNTFLGACLTLDSAATMEKISEMMNQRGLTDREIGELLNLSVQSVNKWRNCKSLPDVENLYALSMILESSVDNMFVSAPEANPCLWRNWSNTNYEPMDETRQRILEYYIWKRGL